MNTPKQLLQEAIEEYDKGDISIAAQLAYSASIKLAQEAMGTSAVKVETSYFRKTIDKLYGRNVGTPTVQ